MVDIGELKKSEFWNKKIRRAVETHDADKNGSITRSDFELVVERYKMNAGGTTDKIEKLSEVMFSFCDKIGLGDSAVLSYEEFEKRWQVVMAQDQDNINRLFKTIFECLDPNGDNIIDINEWEIHNAAMGIPPRYAQDSFNAMDKDGDEKITMDEFVNYQTEFLLTTENKLNSAILYGPL